MTREHYIRGRRVRPNPSQLLGEGGEADVFDISETFPNTALKIWKLPSHPDYKGTDEQAKRNRKGAERRIVEHQTKMLEFPKKLPNRIITPKDLATNRGGKRIHGYTMDLLPPGKAHALKEFTRRRFREHVSYDTVVEIFGDLHKTISETHHAGVVIGDFNDLNVLVVDTAAYLLDADSMQFGRFLTKTFTSRFVDPLICDPDESHLIQYKPHMAETDWYAYAVMLFEAMLFVHPYGGIYEPRKASKRVKHDERPLRRISVFHPGVTYPTKAMPLDWVDEDLLHYFESVFVKDRREIFPEMLLRRLRWTECSHCGIVHSRTRCPVCAHAAPRQAVLEQIRGKVRARRIFDTSGRIVHATIERGELNWVFHRENAFWREDNSEVLAGEIAPDIRYRVSGRKTVFARGSQLFIAEPEKEVQQVPVDLFRGKLPILDTNDKHVYWVANGELQRDGRFGPEFIGKVYAGNTLIWAGPRFGFGFYRAGEISVAFVFDAERSGINDSVEIPRIRGKLVDVTCYFTDDRCWFFTATQEGGRIIHRVSVIDAEGKVLSTEQGEEDDGSWLATIRGKSAATLGGSGGSKVHALFAVTDNGIVRVDESGGRISETAAFPDTRGFVNPADHIFFTKQGIAVVKRDEIRLLTIGS